jgi:aminoglycoside 3-N-acetyltransferase
MDATPATRDSLAADLRRLGVTPGGVLWVHASYKSLGPVTGGAAAAIGALEDALGPAGLLLMPVFNLLPGGRDVRAAAWQPATSPSTVGWLTEAFRQLPGTVRSDHYSHSVAARGQGAAAFVADHRRTEGMPSPWDLPPWGATYGDHSPFLRAYHAPGAQILLLGVDYHSSTYCHLVEVFDWARRRALDPGAKYWWVDRDKLGAGWDAHGHLVRGRVAQADCRLFLLREFVDTLRDWLAADPARWCKGG